MAARFTENEVRGILSLAQPRSNEEYAVHSVRLLAEDWLRLHADLVAVTAGFLAYHENPRHDIEHDEPHLVEDVRTAAKLCESMEDE